MGDLAERLLILLCVVYVFDLAFRLSGWWIERYALRRMRRPRRSEPMSLGPSVLGPRISEHPLVPSRTGRGSRELPGFLRGTFEVTDPFHLRRLSRVAKRTLGARAQVRERFAPLPPGAAILGLGSRLHPDGWVRGRVVIDEVEYPALGRADDKLLDVEPGDEILVADAAMDGDSLYLVVVPLPVSMSRMNPREQSE